jgi:hypothetical protein
MQNIDPRRLEFALSETKHTDGASFEEFANSFLSTEFPNLQPIGGMHDSGTDAALYSSHTFPTTFIQSSVTEKFVDKIRRTVARITQTKSDCRELIYCSPHSIAKESEGIAAELRKANISLQLRERTYFVAFCNNSQGRAAASEGYFRKIGAPILSAARLISSDEIQLTTDEEKLALAYFGAVLDSADSEKSLVSTCYEAVVLYCLRDSNNERRITKGQIVAESRKIAFADHGDIFEQRVNGALVKLVAKKAVRNPDGLYHLAHAEKERADSKLLERYQQTARAYEEMAGFIAALRVTLSMSIEMPPGVECQVLLAIVNAVLCKQSESATGALTRGEFAAVERADLRPIVSAKIHESGVNLSKDELAKANDFFIILSETIIDQPPPTMADYFRRVGDAYFLFFLLRQPPGVQDILNKLIGRSNIVVDASVLIPCLAEMAFAPELRSKQNVIRAAIDSGARVYVTDLGLAEIVTHTVKARAIHDRIVQRQSYFGQSALVDAFVSKLNINFTSFAEFIETILGTDSRIDLPELLRLELDVSLLTMPDFSTLNRETVDPLFAAWRAIRARYEGMDEADYFSLIYNDLRTYLFLKDRRQGQDPKETVYGETWWWLTEDTTAHSIDRSNTPSQKSTICMQADYLLRYVSIMPRRRDVDRGTELSLLPISIDMAGLGFIPDEIMEANRQAAGINDDEPSFVRQRKLRAYINTSRALTR